MERQKFFYIYVGKVHVLLLRIKKRSILKKRLKKKRSDEKKNMENTHTRVNMLKKREVVLHKKCRKKNPFSTLLSSVSFFRPTHTTTRTRTTLTTTTRIYIYIYIFFFYQWTAWRAMSPFLPLGVKLTHFCARAKPSHRVTKRRSWNKRKSKDS